MKTIKHEAYLVIAEKLFIAVVVGVFGVVSVHSSSAKKQLTNTEIGKTLEKAQQK